ncbi:MAG: LacI family DNA-binding transcriptional regulator [Alphaproteobacteria bacterium]|nr:LacI family DNA-binding transcriptional regulator [Alphaproteobacteria bacterium]
MARKRASRAGGGVRMHDVARLAAVSPITVSRALSQPDKVSAETRRRVEAAIAQVGYVPNLTAGSLASNRSRIIAAVVPTIANSIFADTVQGLSDQLERQGYQLLLGQTGYSETTEDELIRAFLGRRPDALVLTGIGRSAAARALLRNAEIPIVETWDLTAAPLDMLVGFSNRDAGRAMAEFFLARGYRRLAFVGSTDQRSQARRAGFLAAAPDALTIALDEQASVPRGRAALQRVRAEAPDVQAIFFSTDVLAVGALLECQRLGLAVPRELAIAGLGDLPIAAEINPALTTIEIRGYAIGEHAARMLLQRLAGERVAPKIVDLGFRIVARASA